MRLYNAKGEEWDGEPIDARIMLQSGMWFETKPEPKPEPKPEIEQPKRGRKAKE